MKALYKITRSQVHKSRSRHVNRIGTFPVYERVQSIYEIRKIRQFHLGRNVL